MKNEEILEEIDEEAERIVKWLKKQPEDFLDYFILSFITKSELSYFETLGLLEHVKSEIQRITNEEAWNDY